MTRVNQTLVAVVIYHPETTLKTETWFCSEELPSLREAALLKVISISRGSWGKGPPSRLNSDISKGLSVPELLRGSTEASVNT